MSGTVLIRLAKPIASVRLTEDYPDKAAGTSTEAGQAGPTQQLQRQNAEVSGLCRTLQNIIDKLNQFYEKAFSGHKEQVAKLSVEIARKILMQKIQDGDYEIESIVSEALKNTSVRQGLVVHLNPDDLGIFQKARDDAPTGGLAGIKLVADPSVGRAECLVESPKGTIQSLIEEHLEQVEKALQKAE